MNVSLVGKFESLLYKKRTHLMQIYWNQGYLSLKAGIQQNFWCHLSVLG